MTEFRFDNRVAVITGAGGGLGKQHALSLAQRGCSVVVNDVPPRDKSEALADQVVQDIEALGGEAIAVSEYVEDGDRTIQAAMDWFGRVDIVINNAGILRDRTFAKMSIADWQDITNVHLFGAFRVTRAAWPLMQKNKFGRIINTCSAAMFGNFGQANYSMAKAGLFGLTRTLALEGAKHHIMVNAIAPIASSQLLETIAPKEVAEKLSPECVSALVLKLCSEQNNENGSLFEVAGGWISKVRYERSEGLLLSGMDAQSPEAIEEHWSRICNFDNSSVPDSALDSLSRALKIIDVHVPDYSYGTNLNKLDEKHD